jgi:hypothetical protein
LTDPTQNPHPLNVPGPFYVLDGCCTNCGVPKLFAEANFSLTPDHHCYVSRQPANESELDGMLDVIVNAELACIRYAESDVRVLQRLADAEAAAQCDNPSRVPIRGVIRTYASFRARLEHVEAFTVLAEIQRRLLAMSPDHRATEVVQENGSARFTIAWYEDHFHRIEITESPVRPGYFLLRQHGPLALSKSIDEVLRQGEFQDIQWSPSASGEQASPHPW